MSPNAPVRDECHAPPKTKRNPRHNQRRHDRADICSGVKDSGGQSPLFLRKPLRDRLDRRGEAARLANPQAEARRRKLKYRTGGRMRHRRDTPKQHRQRKAFARPNPVNQFPDEQQARPHKRTEKRQQCCCIRFPSIRTALAVSASAARSPAGPCNSLTLRKTAARRSASGCFRLRCRSRRESLHRNSKWTNRSSKSPGILECGTPNITTRRRWRTHSN